VRHPTGQNTAGQSAPPLKPPDQPHEGTGAPPGPPGQRCAAGADRQLPQQHRGTRLPGRPRAATSAALKAAEMNTINTVKNLCSQRRHRWRPRFCRPRPRTRASRTPTGGLRCGRRRVAPADLRGIQGGHRRGDARRGGRAVTPARLPDPRRAPLRLALLSCQL
jgi:hypothetical protein